MKQKYQNICASDLHYQAFGQACWIKDDLPRQQKVSTFSIAKNEYHHVHLYYEDVEDKKEEGDIKTGGVRKYSKLAHRAQQVLNSLNFNFMDIGANSIRRRVSPKIKP